MLKKTALLENNGFHYQRGREQPRQSLLGATGARKRSRQWQGPPLRENPFSFICSAFGHCSFGGVGHSASEGGCFRQVSIVSKMLIFSLDDYFKLFYTCFQHGNLFISIYEQTQDISIFPWPETAKNETLFWLVGAGMELARNW